VREPEQHAFAQIVSFLGTFDIWLQQSIGWEFVASFIHASKVGSLEFLQKLNGIQKSVGQNGAGKLLLDWIHYYYKKYTVDGKNDRIWTQICSFRSIFLENINHCTSKTSLFFGTVEPDTSWDIITSVDLWEDGGSYDGYVLVKQEDVVDVMTSFMAACLVSIKRTQGRCFLHLMGSLCWASSFMSLHLCMRGALHI
jgi:hypothetical protein